MIRLTATSIDISQDDVASQISQLDIYVGLLKQGFNKHEVREYFAKLAKEQNPRHASTPLSPPLSTLGLMSMAQQRELECEVEPSINFASSAAEQPSTSKAANEPNHAALRFPHAPRQSSLLKFSKIISSSSSTPDQSTLPVPFSPRSQVTFRHRSQTYSYEQSERDPEDLLSPEAVQMPPLEHISLDDIPIPESVESSRTTVRIVSNLRPEAEAFTPSGPVMGWAIEEASSITSTSRSLPSSPPVVNNDGQGRGNSSPRLPPYPVTPHQLRREPSGTTQPRSRSAFLDGTFTIYNDAVPTHMQPQTPADLQRQPFTRIYNAAYTAPPGFLRSPVSQTLDEGDLSPTAHAIRVRHRRRREYERSTRLNQQFNRPRRINDDIFPGDAGLGDVEFWRGELEADAVGEENFEDTHVPAGRHMRAVSGNRRA